MAREVGEGGMGGQRAGENIHEMRGLTIRLK